ncbi:hypothetical protein R0J87_02310 [Halomonas sp. SIMBA_159]
MDANLLIEKLVEIKKKRESLENARATGPCNCEMHKEIKTREFGGGTHYVYQCNKCGEQRGGSLKKIDAIKMLNGKKPKVFDSNIEEERSIKNRIAYEEISSLWDEELRITNAINGFPDCQSTFLAEQKKFGELNDKLAQLIENIKDEFGSVMAIRALINQTVLLKKEKYNELREATERFTSEPELKNWFNEKLATDFYVYPEVNGVHLSENVNVRIDYVLFPKDHLIEEGFEPSYFGVEVKYFNQENGFTHKTSRGLWQAISYNDSRFHLDNKEIKLKYSLIFSNLSFSKECMLIKNYGHEMENDQLEWRGMIHVANHARVGELEIKGNKEVYKGWSIKFAGGTYFGSTVYNNESKYKKSNEDVINKVRVGNF